MNELVYPREKSLGLITLVLGSLIWLFLIIAFKGAVLGFILIGFIAYLFAQSALIAHIKGNGVELSNTQFPDLYAQFEVCCNQLDLVKRPQIFLLYSNLGLNAFATKFLSTQYIILLSDVVNAMEEHEDGVRFYIGHELGHLKRNHLGILHLLRWPVLWLPLLGAAYSRAREYTCDRHGLACSSTSDNAARALAALAAGSERWKKVNFPEFLAQKQYSSGFWMSFHELCAGYPWLTQRTARVIDPNSKLPRRNFFAYILALFVPYLGRLGAGLSLLILIYIIGVLAAIAIPAYQSYTVQAQLTSVVAESVTARDALSQYYLQNQKIPESLEKIGIKSKLADGTVLKINPENMELTATRTSWQLIFVPTVNDEGKITWQCVNGEGLKADQLPSECAASVK